MIERTPAVTPNQLVFDVIRGMKVINFNRQIPILEYIRNDGQLRPTESRPEVLKLWRLSLSKILISKRINPLKFLWHFGPIATR